MAANDTCFGNVLCVSNISCSDKIQSSSVSFFIALLLTSEKNVRTSLRVSFPARKPLGHAAS